MVFLYHCKVRQILAIKGITASEHMWHTGDACHELALSLPHQTCHVHTHNIIVNEMHGFCSWAASLVIPSVLPMMKYVGMSLLINMWKFLCSYLFNKLHWLLLMLKSSRSWFNVEALHVNEYHLKGLSKECDLIKYAGLSSCHE